MIASMQNAIEFTSDDQAYCFTMLGDAYMARFYVLKTEEDLKSAIFSYRKAVDLTPNDHSAHPSRLMILGDTLMTSYKLIGYLEDLNGAISSYQQAVHQWM